MGERCLFPAGTDVRSATWALLDRGIGDGLPVVPPTAERVDAMLGCAPGPAARAGPGARADPDRLAGPDAAADPEWLGGPDAAADPDWLAGQDAAAGRERLAGPDAALGPVPPLFGELTVRAAAWYAVLAGCRPAELPVVLAALRACLEPEFNLLGVQTTTGTAAVAVVVRGPVVAELGMSTGANLLGPGNRANASVGRAVALALAGIGGARPGETDMATTGWPGRYGMCIPVQAGSGGPRSEPVPVRDGVPAHEPGSAVTVLAVGGAAEVLPRSGGGTADAILDPLADACAGAALAAGDPGRMAYCEQSVVLPPDPAAALERLGVPVVDVPDELYRRGNAVLATRGLPGARVAAGPDAVHVLVTGGAGIKMLHLPGWIGGSRAVTRPLG